MFNLNYIHGFRLDELENMVPFERDVYISLLEHHIEEKKQKAG